MRINANIMAVNTQRQLFGAQTSGAKSMEKLSSGFRINRAADDAAGLAISEKMRSQVRGLKQASRNAQDGISVVQTAEGALDEVHSMLQRIKELSVQSASDSNQSYVDRESIQLEVNALTDEIDSISTKTQFNKMTLLDGTFADKKFHVGANSSENIAITIDAMDTKGLKLEEYGSEKISPGLNAAVTGSDVGKAGNPAMVAKDTTVSLTSISTSGAADDTTLAASPLKLEVTINGVTKNIDVVKKDSTAGAEAVKAIAAAFTEVDVDSTTTNIKMNVATKGDIVIKVKDLGGSGLASAPADIKNAATPDATKPETPTALTVNYETGTNARKGSITLAGQRYDFDLAANADDAAFKTAIEGLKDAAGNQVFDVTGTGTSTVIKVNSSQTGKNLEKMSISLQGTAKAEKDVAYRGVNVLTQAKANETIDKVQTSIELLASRRAQLGAIQNRVEHTIKNLDNSHENLVAAESRVRHVDMALEIIENTRQNILQQASTSMLAQANQAPQTVLQLLR